MDLFEETESQHEDKPLISINQDYAKNYNKWRKGEELQKLKDKYGDEYANNEFSSSSSEEEDEDAVELTESVEADFFKTLAYLKEKNPRIYDENSVFFNKTNMDSVPKKIGKPATMSMAAYHRQLLVDTKGIIESDDNTARDVTSNLPLVEQEKALKESFKAALANDINDDEDFLKPKIKTAAEKAVEETDYRQWLAGQTTSAPKEASELKGLRDYWADPKLEEGEKFLRDYIINHRYLEKGEDHFSNYMTDSEDEAIKEQEDFERKFNFRFEEPDQDFIKRYPRTVEQSMRKRDDRRKKHRDEVKERKQKERAQKDEELKRLKVLKRAEILEKIKKLQEVTGNDEMAFQNNDVDGDFDPEEHDKRMTQLFADDYYNVKNIDDKKPEFPEIDEELEIDNWDKWKPGTENHEEVDIAEPHCEDADFIMDCDYDPTKQIPDEVKDNMKRKRKRRQSKFSEALTNPKPTFDPSSSKFEKYLDEYYSLNYEDLIGDIPCRFKYRKTIPNDFGLSIEEILSAPDRELNRWASSKKIMKRRPEHVELYEVKAYRTKAHDLYKKKLCLPSLYDSPENEDDVNSSTILEDSNTSTNGSMIVIEKRKKTRKQIEKEEPENDSYISVMNPENSMKNKNTGSTNKIKAKVSPENKKKKTKHMLKNKGITSSNIRNNLHREAVTKKTKKIVGNGHESTDDFKRTGHHSNVMITIKKKGHKLKNEKAHKGSMRSQYDKKMPKRLLIPIADAEESHSVANLTNSRLKSYGINPKKFKNKLKYGQSKN